MRALQANRPFLLLSTLSASALPHYRYYNTTVILTTGTLLNTMITWSSAILFVYLNLILPLMVYVMRQKRIIEHFGGYAGEKRGGTSSNY